MCGKRIYPMVDLIAACDSGLELEAAVVEELLSTSVLNFCFLGSRSKGRTEGLRLGRVNL